MQAGPRPEMAGSAGSRREEGWGRGLITLPPGARWGIISKHCRKQG